MTVGDFLSQIRESVFEPLDLCIGDIDGGLNTQGVGCRNCGENSDLMASQQKGAREVPRQLFIAQYAQKKTRVSRKVGQLNPHQQPLAANGSKGRRIFIFDALQDSHEFVACFLCPLGDLLVPDDSKDLAGHRSSKPPR